MIALVILLCYSEYANAEVVKGLIVSQTLFVYLPILLNISSIVQT